MAVTEAKDMTIPVFPVVVTMEEMAETVVVEGRVLLMVNMCSLETAEMAVKADTLVPTGKVSMEEMAEKVLMVEEGAMEKMQKHGGLLAEKVVMEEIVMAERLEPKALAEQVVDGETRGLMETLDKRRMITKPIIPMFK